MLPAADSSGFRLSADSIDAGIDDGAGAAELTDEETRADAVFAERLRLLAGAFAFGAAFGRFLAVDGGGAVCEEDDEEDAVAALLPLLLADVEAAAALLPLMLADIEAAAAFAILAERRVGGSSLSFFYKHKPMKKSNWQNMSCCSIARV